MTQFIRTNDIQIAYDDQGTGAPTLILLHGLTANRRSFDGLLAAGLADGRRVVRVDLRGRGDSDKPETGYHMRDHAADVLGLLDALDTQRPVLVGHSFGGLLALYLALHHPERIAKIAILDVGLQATDPAVLPKIKPSLDRLGTVMPSAEVYIEAIKQSAYYADGFWTEGLEQYYRADLETLEDGQVRTRVYGAGIEEAVQHIIADDWADIMRRVPRPTLLIHAPEPFGTGDAPPILTPAGAQETVDLIPDCQYQRVTGHHITMIFGEHAAGVVTAIDDFITA